MTAPMVIAVTGHRPGRLGPGGAARVRHEMRRLVMRHRGAVWRTGGAVGADQIAADVVLDAGQLLELVLPFPPHIQAARWRDDQRERLANQIARAHDVVCLADVYDAAVYHERNLELVHAADVLVAFWDGRPSGTAATVRAAHQACVPVYWVAVP